MNYYGSKCQVYKGSAHITKGGLTKKDIIKIKDSSGNTRYKSKEQQKKGHKKKTFREKWSKAMKKARKLLIKEGKIPNNTFIPLGGTSREGKLLLKKTRELI